MKRLGTWTKKFNQWFKRFRADPRSPGIVALLGGILYFIQAWLFAHNLLSIMDEGLYLYKGYLFASGRYAPYQDYGPWTNHMPLSFVIPGYIQLWFGPGLSTGRFYALILSLLSLLGVWILTRRLVGKWPAALAIWLIALNPSQIKTLSWAAAQVLSLTLLIWALVLVTGRERKPWEVAIGSVLAVALALTRINLSPVLPIILVYIFWQHGRKIGGLATAISGLSLVLGIGLYWPEILKFLSNWLPNVVLGVLGYTPPTIGGPVVTVEDVTTQGKIHSFSLGLRYQFIALCAFLFSWLAWPKIKGSTKEPGFKSTTLVFVLFIFLFSLHLLASLGLNYCIYCFPGYIAYFQPLGVLTIIMAYPYWGKRANRLLGVVLMFSVLFLAAGIGFGAFEDIGESLLDIQLPRLLTFFRSWELPIEFVSASRILEAKMGLDYATARRVLPTIAGLIAGVALILLALLLHRTKIVKHLTQGQSVGYTTLVLFLGIGILLSPSELFGGGDDAFVCNQEVISSYESAGSVLAANLSENSLVYWQGYSPVSLLYAPGVNIFPAQLNNLSSLRVNDDSEVLEKFGLWNTELANLWSQEADYALIELGDFYWPEGLADLSGFEEIETTQPINPCDNSTGIQILRRIP